MGILDDKCNEAAVYWPPQRPDRFGKAAQGTAEAIDCHWEDVAEVYTGADGQQFVSRSVVYVKRQLKRQGYLFFGALVDAPADPTSSDDCFQIRLFERVPSVAGDDYVYNAVL